MSLSKDNVRLGDLPAKELEWHWVAHPRCDSIRSSMEAELIAGRADIYLIGNIQDDNASYSYDDFALIVFGGKYYLLNTSGCSCPSPTETWGVVRGPLDLAEMTAAVESEIGAAAEWMMMQRQAGEFREMMAFAAELEAGAS